MMSGVMKKILAVSVLVGMTVALVSCGGAEKSEKAGAAAENRLDKIKESGKIVLGTSADYPPYEFHATIDGKDTIVGFDIEIGKEIAKDLGVELEIKDMKFDGLTAALQAGTIDMAISGMNPTPERQKAVDFSEIYYKAEHGIVIKEENKDKFKTKDDFSGKKVGVQKGSIQEELALTQMKGAEVKGLGKVPDLVMELVSGNADAVVMEIPVAKANAKANKGLYVIENPNFELDESEKGSAVAMPKDSKELVGAINKTIDRLVKENKIEKYIVDSNELMEKEQAK